MAQGKLSVGFDPVRKKKGLMPYAVFRDEGGGFNRGLSQHWTKAEAEAALEKLAGK